MKFDFNRGDGRYRATVRAANDDGTYNVQVWWRMAVHTSWTPSLATLARKPHSCVDTELHPKAAICNPCAWLCDI